MRVFVWAVLAVGVLSLTAPAVGQEAEKRETEKKPPLRLALELSDGSRLIGVPTIRSIVLSTPMADLPIPLERVVGLTAEDQGTKWRVSFRNGDRLTGTLSLTEVEMTTLIGPIRVPLEHVTDMSVSVASASAKDLPAGLAAYFPFDRRGKTVGEASGHGRKVLLQGTTWEREGKVGGARSFDGDDDHLRVANMRLQAFTFAAWVKPRERGINNRRLFYIEEGPRYFAVEGNSRGGLCLKFGADHEVLEYDWTLTPDGWTHVVVTCDGETGKIYRNGTLTETGETPVGSFEGTCFIGGTSRRDGRFWNGWLDEVALFDRGLSENEVQRLYRVAGGR